MVLSHPFAIVALSSLSVAPWSAQPPFAAGSTEASNSPVTTVTVALGQLSEYSIKLSTARVPLGGVAFNVTNDGALPHVFKVCAGATASAAANNCSGKSTSTLKPGQSAVLAVVFEQTGSFEYLSTVPGHTKAGTGLLDVGRNAYGAEKLALAQRVAQCMHSHGFPDYPDNGNSTVSGSKPSVSQATAAEEDCERQARKAAGLP